MSPNFCFVKYLLPRQYFVEDQTGAPHIALFVVIAFLVEDLGRPVNWSASLGSIDKIFANRLGEAKISNFDIFIFV